jgi:hypothetical protein
MEKELRKSRTVTVFMMWTYYVHTPLGVKSFLAVGSVFVSRMQRHAVLMATHRRLTRVRSGIRRVATRDSGSALELI